MGDDVITAATGIPMLTILLHGATTALRVPTRLSIQNTLWCAVSVLPAVLRALLLIAESRIGLLAPCKLEAHRLAILAAPAKTQCPRVIHRLGLVEPQLLTLCHGAVLSSALISLGRDGCDPLDPYGQ